MNFEKIYESAKKIDFDAILRKKCSKLLSNNYTSVEINKIFPFIKDLYCSITRQIDRDTRRSDDYYTDLIKKEATEEYIHKGYEVGLIEYTVIPTVWKLIKDYLDGY